MKPIQETAWWQGIQDPKSQEQLLSLRTEAAARLMEPRWQADREAIESTRDLRANSLEIRNSAVTIGAEDQLNTEQTERLKRALQTFMPWKKGPFSIFQQEIDAEWRSDQKWDRLWPHIGSLAGEIVADIGCNNGYYMYRMQAAGAAHVVGFEPMPRHALSFQMLQNFHPCPRLDFEMFGVEHIDLFAGMFNSIFCLGILYHHTDPVGLLRKMAKALQPRGRIFIDCQGIAGEESVALSPAGRYAGAGGVWFLPTRSCLENWVRRAGFGKIRWIHAAPLEISEQRSTAWAPVKSLSDFLDPEDKGRTVEGYSAPLRFYLMIQL